MHSKKQQLAASFERQAWIIFPRLISHYQLCSTFHNPFNCL